MKRKKTSFSSKTIQLISERDISLAVGAVSKIARNQGFSMMKISEMTLSTSEIVTNAIKFAGHGKITIIKTKNKRGIEICVKDKGPGIKKNRRKYGLGLGIASAKRQMDEFHITSKLGKGTTVTMLKYLPIPEEEIEYGVVSLADPQNKINGDAYVIKEIKGENVLLAVIDGLGQGLKAHKISNILMDYIEEHCTLELDKLVRACHRYLKEGGWYSGVAIGLLLLKPRSLEYIGVGDTFAKIWGKNRKSLYNKGGIVGMSDLPPIQIQKYNYSDTIAIVMCSDGIRDIFEADDLPLEKHTQKIADHIMNEYAREQGDATALVIKRKAK